MDNEDWQPDSAPGFYKIILPGIILQEKLRIPKDFIETFGDELSGFVTLDISDGRNWLVELEKSDHMVFFSNGWQKLVDHYSISSGHVLVFKYRGNSKFNVFIFDITSTGIDHSRHADTEIAGPSSRNKAKFGGSKHSTPEEEEAAAAKLLNRAFFVDFVKNTLLTTQERKTAESAVRAFKSENSAFMAVIRLGNTEKVYQLLDVPVEFSKSYLLPPRKVELEIEDGKRWTVYTAETETKNNGYVGVGGASLRRGWRTFIKENQLTGGDICIFEVIHDKHVILKVSIFKTSN